MITKCGVLIFWIIIFNFASELSCSNINSLFSSEMMQNQDLVKSIASGAQMAVEHCQTKFKWDRWNCPESAFSRRNLQPTTKESSFVSAVLSAGIVHAITRNCSRGELFGCGCDPKKSNFAINDRFRNTMVPEKPSDIFKTNNNWSWGGCSDYLDYGEQVAGNLLDNLENEQDLQAYTNLHNNAVGRMVVRTTMKKKCRCHGVSGSCSMQTCWMQMAPFSEITNELRLKYEKAQKVEHERKFNTIGHPDTVIDSSVKDLVYLVDSPNYCQLDAIPGWNGTSGRACSRNKGDTITLAERKSCKNLCRSCGHRVRRQRRRIIRRCNCSFHWCCEVKCDTCSEIVDDFFCE